MLQKLIRTNVGIIAHGDADGICSAAIVKSLHPGALILFSRASILHKSIKEIERQAKTLEKLFIVDIALNPNSQNFVLERLKKVKNNIKVIYIDNHLLPWEIENNNNDNNDILRYVDHYIRKKNWSSSALTFVELYGPNKEDIIGNRRHALLGAYGAIADYAKKCPLLKEITGLWDESSIYYQAFLLKQASRVIQSNNMKRNIADKLSVGILPSEIFEVVEAAREASREVDMAIQFIQQHAQKYGEIGIIFECPIASMGHNAYVTATMTDSKIGVAIRRRSGNAYFVIRKQHDCEIHLGELAAKIANKMECNGGGEEFTAGITVIDEYIVQVLQLLDNHVSNFNKHKKL